MLQRLVIKNIALIEALELSFGKGFHALTGETGAGKSILIDAIGFVLGERASRDMIKTGAEKASVEAAFEPDDAPGLLERLEELGIEAEEGEPLILSRELTAAGRNTCRINGVMVTRAALQSVTALLVDLHGQHEHQSLLDAGKHMDFLDSFGAESIVPIRESISNCYARYAAAEKRLNSGFPSEQERERRMDILRYQIDEIDAARLRDGEEEELRGQHRLLSNAQDIRAALEGAYEALSGGDGAALNQTGGAVKAMEPIADMSPEYEQAHRDLLDAYYTLEDLALSLRDMKNSFYFDPAELERTEERLDRIRALKRKYGGSIAEILAMRESMAGELQELDESDELRGRLAAERDEALREYAILAKKLHEARAAAGEILAGRVAAELRQLGMERARLSVAVEFMEDAKPAPNGLDRVEFLLSANAGEPLKPLNRVASGGELSRIMLAFKTVAADLDGVPTLIFDEIDTGVGGRIALVVGEKMRQTASTRQVLCVTHLAQIAAMAQTHFFVEKVERDGRTYTLVTELTEEERCRELARIMGGRETDVHAMEHARELLRMTGKS